MSDLLRRAFYRNFHLVPHRLMNRVLAHAIRLRLPAPALRAAVRLWVARGLEMDDFHKGPFATLEEVFLRRILEGRRPLGEGMVSPVDGFLVGSGTIAAGGALEVKGEALSFERLCSVGREDARRYEGGSFVIIFLSPGGYHWVHMPVDGTITGHHWISGERFPQNVVALEHIPRVHERNSRAVLHCRSHAGEEFILILVGASMVSGIHVVGLEPTAPTTHCSVRRCKGDEVGYFTIGSTVVLLTHRSIAELRTPGPGGRVRMGETLFSAGS